MTATTQIVKTVKQTVKGNPFAGKDAGKPVGAKATAKAVTLAPSAATGEPGAIVANPTKAGDQIGEGYYFLPGARPSEPAIKAAVKAALHGYAELVRAQLSDDGSWIWTEIKIDGTTDYYAVRRDVDAQSIFYPGSNTADRAAWAKLDPASFLAAENAAKEARQRARQKESDALAAAKNVLAAAVLPPKAPIVPTLPVVVPPGQKLSVKETEAVKAAAKEAPKAKPAPFGKKTGKTAQASA